MKQEKTRKKNKKPVAAVVWIILAAVVIAVLAAIVILAVHKSPESETAETDASQDTDAVNNDNQIITTVEWKGKTYKYNSSLINILFLGIDKSDSISLDYVPGTAGQSDCIILLSLNEETQQAMILQINRNAMTAIDIYNSSGSVTNTITAQICLQYAYSTGNNASCRAVRDTVSELLFGLDIDGYFALDIDGVPEINDALGGVDVTMSYDYTYLDESYTEGATVHLEGEAAQKFVQYRDIDEFNSVEGRMYRQVDYVTALITSLNSSSGVDLYEVLSSYLDIYVITDLDADELKAMKNYEYLTDSVLYLPGETIMGDKYEEFYIDEEELQDLLIENFYVEVESE